MKKTLLAASTVCLLTSGYSHANDYIIMDESNPANKLLLSNLIRPSNLSALQEEDTIVDVMFFFQNSYVDLLGQQVAHTRITEWVDTINTIAVEQEMGFQLRIANALIAPSIGDELFLEDETDENDEIITLGASTLFFNAVFNANAGQGGSPLPEFEIYNAYGADIAIYVRDFRESDDTANVLGRASFGGPVNMMFDRFDGTPSVSERLFDNVFTHEIGHNLGAGHEVDIDDNPPFAEVDAHAATCGNNNTIMFSSLGNSTLASFSDPELTNNDEFCGEEGLENNRRVIIENAVMTSLRGTGAISLGQFSFTSAQFNASEQDGTATITIARTGDLTQASEVEVALFDDTAIQGADFVNGIARANFNAGESETTVAFEIIEDALDEGQEQINVALRYPLLGQLGQLSTATLLISDGVAGNIGTIETTSPTTVVEGEDISFTLNRVGGSDGELVVNITTSDQTAFSGQDYQTFNQSVVFAAGETSQTVAITTIDDNLSEVDETFAITITSQQTQVTGGNLVATIQDNEPLAGQFNVSVSTRSVSESDGSVTIIVDRVNGTAGPASLRVTTSGGGNSIVPVNEVVNFTDGQTQQTVLVTVNDDTTEEIDQIVTVNLEAIGDENVTTSFVTFTVFDNDGDNAPPSDSGGGSTGLLGLLAASLTLFRRRKVVK
jgi:hypothetical protein